MNWKCNMGTFLHHPHLQNASIIAHMADWSCSVYRRGLSRGTCPLNPALLLSGCGKDCHSLGGSALPSVLELLHVELMWHLLFPVAPVGNPEMGGDQIFEDYTSSVDDPPVQVIRAVGTQQDSG